MNSIQKSLELVSRWEIERSWNSDRQERLKFFLENPVEESICSVPGIGETTSATLSEVDIKNTWQLIGIFCYRFNRDSKKFYDYLNEFSNSQILNISKKLIVAAITRKVALMFGDY